MIERTGGGLLVEPGNAQALAGAMQRIWSDLDLARELSQKGASGVREHYSVSREAKSVLEAYSSVLESITCLK